MYFLKMHTVKTFRVWGISSDGNIEMVNCHSLPPLPRAHALATFKGANKACEVVSKVLVCAKKMGSKQASKHDNTSTNPSIQPRRQKNNFHVDGLL